VARTARHPAVDGGRHRQQGFAEPSDHHDGIPLALGAWLGQPSDMNAAAARSRFRTLHEEGTFLMPNPFDQGSCRLLEGLGFPALATTSGGFAASRGRMDMTGERSELVDHVASLCAVTELPLNVDAEQCFPRDEGGVATTVRLLAAAGASGCSIEDWDPRDGAIEDIDRATQQVAIAAAAADDEGLLLTARAENHLRGRDDLDDTIARLAAYRGAGAHVVYAPALTDLSAIARIVDQVGGPVNVLLLPGGPSLDELAAVGVRRLSVGSALARVAYGAMYGAARDLLDSGGLSTGGPYLDRGIASSAFKAVNERS
jgi:2-methylisocitrate lyase-like PEP mutase family enzyme